MGKFVFMIIYCPKCKTEYDVEENDIGSSATCEKCACDFIIRNLKKCHFCDELVDENVRVCPNCKKSVEVIDDSYVIPLAQNVSGHTEKTNDTFDSEIHKKCMYCGKTVKRNALLCKHCRKKLPEEVLTGDNDALQDESRYAGQDDLLVSEHSSRLSPDSRKNETGFVSDAGGMSKEKIENKEHEFFDTVLTKNVTHPLITYSIVGINILVFILMVISGVNMVSPSTMDILKFGGSYGFNVANGEYWRLFSPAFIHIGIIHLAFNIWALLSVGPLSERLLGRYGFIVTYVLSAIGGTLASLLIHPQIVCAGASGAVFGICGSIAGVLVVRQKMIPKSVLVSLGKGIGAMIIFNLYYGFTKSGIDNAAHIGGLLVGFACGMILSHDLSDLYYEQVKPKFLMSLIPIFLIILVGGSVLARVRDAKIPDLKQVALQVALDVDKNRKLAEENKKLYREKEENAKDIIQYLNESLPKISPVEQDAFGHLKRAFLYAESLPSDGAGLARIIRDDAIPAFNRLKNTLIAVKPQTAAVRNVHQIMINSVDMKIDAMNQALRAIKYNTNSEFDESMDKMNKSNNMLVQFKDELESIAGKNGVIIRKK